MKDTVLLDKIMRCNHILVIGSFAIFSGLFILWSHFQRTVEEQALSNGVFFSVFALSIGAFAYVLAHYMKFMAQKNLELRHQDKQWTGVGNDH